MKVIFECPVCSETRWYEASRHRYRLNEERDHNAHHSGCEIEYLKLRRRVMFELWWVNGEEVELITVVCISCGFVCYSPRPDRKDLIAKYIFLRDHEKLGAAHAGGRRTCRLLSARSKYLREAILGLTKQAPHKVLDVGGGDGRLLQPFLELGSECFLVDFNQSPISGVCRLGTELEEIPFGMTFDVIICSHVLEHVAEPMVMLRRARDLLSPNGLLYIEVPLEVWKGVPIASDPVTHINFFTKKVLEAALLLAGLSPVMSEKRVAPYGEYYIRVVSIMAKRGNERQADNKGVEEAIGFLRPSFWENVCRLFVNIKIDVFLNCVPTIKSLVAKFTYKNRCVVAIDATEERNV